MFVNVYMLKRNTWRRVKNSPYDHSVKCPASGIFLNGSLHWLASKVSDHSFTIAAFDLTTEEFLEVALPSGVDNYNLLLHELAVVGECLCLIYCTIYGHNDVWVMKKYGVEESWTKISFSYSDLSFIWPKISFSYNDLSCTWPIHLFGDVKVLLAKDRNKVVVYKLEDETSRDTAVLGIPSWFRVGLTLWAALSHLIAAMR